MSFRSMIRALFRRFRPNTPSSSSNGSQAATERARRAQIFHAARQAAAGYPLPPVPPEGGINFVYTIIRTETISEPGTRVRRVDQERLELVQPGQTPMGPIAHQMYVFPGPAGIHGR